MMPQQLDIIRKLADATNPVASVLTAWRGGSIYIYETNDTRVPFYLDTQLDSEGRAKA